MMCSYAEKFCYEIARRACVIQKYAVTLYEIDITFSLELGYISKLKPTLIMSATEFTYLNMSASGRPSVGVASLMKYETYRNKGENVGSSLPSGVHM